MTIILEKDTYGRMAENLSSGEEVVALGWMDDGRECVLRIRAGDGRLEVRCIYRPSWCRTLSGIISIRNARAVHLEDGAILFESLPPYFRNIVVERADRKCFRTR